MNSKQVGDYGERIACYYLKKKGYRILQRNYFKEWSALSKGEIDIIAKKHKIICFVEVKTLIQPIEKGVVFLPEDRVDFQKQKKLVKIANNWLNENNIDLDFKWQIDVVSVKADLNTKKAKIKHFENIVQDLL